MISDRMDINRVLMEMRSIKSQAQVFKPENTMADAVQGKKPLEPLHSAKETSDFGDLLSQAVNKVNDLQKNSNNLATQYQQGVDGVDITDVMIASQKASVSFQSMLQVRNKVVEAYRDVMNMPV